MKQQNTYPGWEHDPYHPLVCERVPIGTSVPLDKIACISPNRRPFWKVARATVVGGENYRQIYYQNGLFWAYYGLGYQDAVKIWPERFEEEPLANDSTQFDERYNPPDDTGQFVAAVGKTFIVFSTVVLILRRVFRR